MGNNAFSRIFRPFVYDLFIAGEKQDEIKATMEKMHKGGIVPLLSPMLEDCENAQMQKRNLHVINDNLDLLNSENWRRPKCLAIKLTAFFTSDHLVQKIIFVNLSFLTDHFRIR